MRASVSTALETFIIVVVVVIIAVVVVVCLQSMSIPGSIVEQRQPGWERARARVGVSVSTACVRELSFSCRSIA